MASKTVAADLRPEFATVRMVHDQVISIVDPLYYRAEKYVGMSFPLIVNKYTGLIVALSFFPVMGFAIPIAILACTIGLPIFLPLAIITGIICAINVALILAVLAISPPGRKRLLQPAIDSVLAEEAGRQLVYSGGPRPSPIAIANAFSPKSPLYQLFLCLVMDLILGNASYLVPLLGEGFDVIWAPMQAVMMGAMFDKQMPSAKWIGLAEELLPMTDILPSATLSWLRCNSTYLQDAVTTLKPNSRISEVKEEKREERKQRSTPLSVRPTDSPRLKTVLC